MLRLLLSRLLNIVPVLLVVSLLSFLVVNLGSGDPAAEVLGESATPDQYAYVRAEMGLDEPLWQRYLDWLWGALHGDLGTTLAPPHTSVSEMIAGRLPVTIQLAAMAVAIALVVAIPIAIWTAYRVGSAMDRSVLAIGAVVLSVPSFVGALLLIWLVIFNADVARLAILIGCVLVGLVGLVLALRRGTGARRGLLWSAAWIAVGGLVYLYFPTFPRQGYVPIDWASILPSFRSLLLPAICLALPEIAIFQRVLRTDAITTTQQDFVQVARAMGMPTWHILAREVLRPSLFSLVTVAGITFGRLLGGTVVIEAIFQLPGIGSMIVNGVYKSDYMVVQGGVLVVASCFVLVNAFVDVVYPALDPRARASDLGRRRQRAARKTEDATTSVVSRVAP